MLQLFWTYCFRHADSWSALAQHAEHLHTRLFFPSASHRTKCPEVPTRLQRLFLDICLVKLVKHAVTRQIIPVLQSAVENLTATLPRSTGSSLGSLGSALMSTLSSFSGLLPEPVAIERAIQAIASYMHYLGSANSDNGPKIDYPYALPEQAQWSTQDRATVNAGSEHSGVCAKVAKLLVLLDKHLSSSSSLSGLQEDKQAHAQLFVFILDALPALFHTDMLAIVVKWAASDSRAVGPGALSALLRILDTHSEEEDLCTMGHADILQHLSRSHGNTDALLTSLCAILHRRSPSPVDTISVVAVHVLSFSPSTRMLALSCLRLIRSFIPPDTADPALAQMYDELPSLLQLSDSELIDDAVFARAFLGAPTVAAMIKPSIYRALLALSSRLTKCKSVSIEEGPAEEQHNVQPSAVLQWQAYASFFLSNGAFASSSHGSRQSAFSSPSDIFSIVFVPFIQHPVHCIRQACLSALHSMNPEFVDAFIATAWHPLARPLSAAYTKGRFRFTRKNSAIVLKRSDLLKADLTHALHNAIVDRLLVDSHAHGTARLTTIRQYIVELFYFLIEVDRDNAIPQLRYWACRTAAAFVRRLRGCPQLMPLLWPARLHRDIWTAMHGWWQQGREGGGAKKLSLDSHQRGTPGETDKRQQQGQNGHAGYSTRSSSTDSLATSLAAVTLQSSSSLSFGSSTLDFQPDVTEALHEGLLSLLFHLPLVDYERVLSWLDSLLLAGCSKRDADFVDAVCSMLANPDTRPSLIDRLFARIYSGSDSSLAYAHAVFMAVDRAAVDLPLASLVVMALYFDKELLTDTLLGSEGSREGRRGGVELSHALAANVDTETSIQVILEGCARLSDASLLAPWIANVVFIPSSYSATGLADDSNGLLLSSLFDRTVRANAHFTHAMSRAWQQFCLWPHHIPIILSFLLSKCTSSTGDSSSSCSMFILESLAIVDPSGTVGSLIGLTQQHDRRGDAKTALCWLDRLQSHYAIALGPLEADRIAHARYVYLDDCYLDEYHGSNADVALEWALSSSSDRSVRSRSWHAYRSIRCFTAEHLRLILDSVAMHASQEDECFETFAAMIDAGLMDSRLLQCTHPRVLVALIRRGFFRDCIHSMPASSFESPDVVIAALDKLDSAEHIVRIFLHCMPAIASAIISRTQTGILKGFADCLARLLPSPTDLCDPLAELAALLPRLPEYGPEDSAAMLSRVLCCLVAGEEQDAVIEAAGRRCNARFGGPFLVHYLSNVQATDSCDVQLLEAVVMRMLDERQPAAVDAILQHMLLGMSRRINC